MFGCKSVSVTAIISNSSVKVLRKSNLFPAQRIFTGMLHIETELSLRLEWLSNSGPGLITLALPMIRYIVVQTTEKQYLD